jgi:hypothetical protein
LEHAGRKTAKNRLPSTLASSTIIPGPGVTIVAGATPLAVRAGSVLEIVQTTV